MNNLEISDIKVVSCENSPFIQPSRVILKQNGVERKWDYIRVHDDVYILLYNESRQAFVLVKQFRAALYMTINREKAINGNDLLTEDVKKVDGSLPFNMPISSGVTYELCAGLVDKQGSLIQVAKEELLEECGYNVPSEILQKVTSWRNELSHACNRQTLFYAEVTDDMIVAGQGGGNDHEGEVIEVFYLPLSEMRAFMYNEEITKESSLMFAFLWWIENVQKTKQ